MLTNDFITVKLPEVVPRHPGWINFIVSKCCRCCWWWRCWCWKLMISGLMGRKVKLLQIFSVVYLFNTIEFVLRRHLHCPLGFNLKLGQYSATFEDIVSKLEREVCLYIECVQDTCILSYCCCCCCCWTANRQGKLREISDRCILWSNITYGIKTFVWPYRHFSMDVKNSILVT